MLLIPHTPTFFEWVALIYDDSNRARQHMISLQAQLKIQGFMADPALTVSIEAYERAQTLLNSNPMSPEKTKRIDSLKRIGIAALGPYPNVDDWQKLIDNDPEFARKVFIALETKQALMGLQTPQAVINSIEIYRTLIATTPK